MLAIVNGRPHGCQIDLSVALEGHAVPGLVRHVHAATSLTLFLSRLGVVCWVMFGGGEQLWMSIEAEKQAPNRST